jgi:sterol desaturase/sphingolipid hydroxylase (fatty acid hydroxylase superfamily)
MTYDDFVMKIVLATIAIIIYFGLMVLEQKAEGRPYPERKDWTKRGWLFFLLSAVITLPFPIFVHSQNLFGGSILEMGHLGPIAGGLLGWLVYTFPAYWFHRASHDIVNLWRWTHQMHHAPVRNDAASSSVVHPVESVCYALIIIFTAIGLLGLSLQATFVMLLMIQLYAFFPHTNVKTPRWVGYFIQRPEGHVLHHARELKKVNYGDFPIWDMLFGTYVNPEEYSLEPLGFGDGKDEAYMDMLKGRLVS